MNHRSFGLDQLSPGTKSLLLRFEKAARDYERAYERAVHPVQREHEQYIAAKRAIVRRLRRLEGTLPRDRRGRRSSSSSTGG